MSDLINHAKSNLSSNAIVVPTLQAFVLLFEADSLRQLPTESLGMERSAHVHTGLSPLIDLSTQLLQFKDFNKNYLKERRQDEKYSKDSRIYEDVCSSLFFYEYGSQELPIYKFNSVVNLLIFEETRSDMAPLLPNFLAHMFPKVCPRMNLFTFAELIIR